MNFPSLFLHRQSIVGLVLLLSGMLFSASAAAQMSWMFGTESDPAAPPVTQVDFAELGQPGGAPAVGSSVAPLPAPTSPPAPASVAVEIQEPLPLAEETRRWYSYPWMWAWSGWTNSAEFGLNASEGNTNSLSLQTGAELKRETERYTFGIDFDYYRTKTGGEVTQDYGRVNFDYDRLLGDSRWSAFGKLGLEWNEFRPFDLRLNLNGGAGYHWFRNDESTVVTRFGAGASREIGAPDDAWVPEALFGVEAEHQITSQQKLKAKIDYFPNWGDFADYRLVSDISWEILLDDSDNLSLKLAATNRYDSTPQGALPRDLFYSMLLLYKF
ncbi:DUF481 domain-containing protein [Roseimaritima ulvae]|uniref:Mucin-like protein n=1 Tax=Roseimaritima ulvae TaxID=980254 RepID=A0A5B9QRK7_9BACT|nr:DUF481 domain-containing protein [Roseimaritima ulvae]QEG41737.1 hypothetical protein UC8_37630 [Roseimaritima ulvae]